jgi:hypothetical protein
MSDEKLDEILKETIRIRTALWPDEGQPGILTQHEKRINSLENWRTWLAGAWSVITLVFSYIFGIHLKRHGG